MVAASKGQSYTPDTTVKGDVNGDGIFNIGDIVVFQKWLLAVPDTTLANWKAADLLADEKLMYLICV